VSSETSPLREVEELEAWFRTQCVDVDQPDLEAIRAAIHCALDERWLRAQFSDAPPGDLAGAIKNRLHSELAAHSAKPVGTSTDAKNHKIPAQRVALWRWSAGIAAAAAAMVFWFRQPTVQRGPSESDGQTGAFFAYDADDFDMALSELEDDVALLESGWRGTWRPSLSDQWDEEWTDRFDHAGNQL